MTTYEINERIERDMFAFASYYISGRINDMYDKNDDMFKKSWKQKFKSAFDNMCDEFHEYGIDDFKTTNYHGDNVAVFVGDEQRAYVNAHRDDIIERIDEKKMMRDVLYRVVNDALCEEDKDDIIETLCDLLTTKSLTEYGNDENAIKIEMAEEDDE